MNLFLTVAIIIGAIIALVLSGIIISFIKVWIRALTSQAHISFTMLIAMTLRGVTPKLIVDARIRAVKAGLEITTEPLEAHYLAGGNVLNVVQALIAADKANLNLSFQNAAAIDLAGRDALSGRLRS